MATSPSRESPSSPSDSATKEQRGDLQFPWKLHLLLEQAEKSGQDHIVSWLPDGKSFKIHNKTAFSEELMLSFFSSNKFKSFQRSLNLWGFETVLKGPNKGSRFHEHFVKGKPDLCQLMIRTKVKGRGGVLPSSPNNKNAGNQHQLPSSPSTTNSRNSREVMGSLSQQHHRAGSVSGIAATTTGNGAGALLPPNFPFAAAMPLGPGALSNLPTKLPGQHQHLMLGGGGVPAFSVNTPTHSWSGNLSGSGRKEQDMPHLKHKQQQHATGGSIQGSIGASLVKQLEDANSGLLLERMLSVIRYLGASSNNNMELTAALAQQQQQQAAGAGSSQQRHAADVTTAMRDQIAALERAGMNFAHMRQQQQQFHPQLVAPPASALARPATTSQLLDSAIMDLVARQILGQASANGAATVPNSGGLLPVANGGTSNAGKPYPGRLN